MNAESQEQQKVCTLATKNDFGSKCSYRMSLALNAITREKIITNKLQKNKNCFY